MALAIFQNHLNGPFRQSISRRVVDELLPDKFTDATLRSKPQSAGLILVQHGDVVVEQPVLRGVIGDFAPDLSAQPAVGAEPQAAIAVLPYEADRIIHQAVFSTKLRNVVAIKPPGAVQCAKPHEPLIVLVQRQHWT